MKPRLQAMFAAGLAVLVLLACTPSALAGRYSPKAIWGPTSWNGQATFPIYHNLGVSIYEAQLHWDAAAPSRPRNPLDPSDPAYQWPAELSNAMQQAAQYHMRILLQVIGTPTWANGGRAWNYPPTRIRDLADFMTAAARRYPNVHLWMVWGEPDRRHNFAIDKTVPHGHRSLTPAQARAPHVYAQMLDASYGALKAVSKQNMVIGGNTFNTGDIPVDLWVQNLRLSNHRPPRMDMYGHNPFTTRDPNLNNPPSGNGYYDFSDLRRLWQLVNRYLTSPHHELKLFLSEWTIPTAPDSEFNYYVTRALQARWIRDGLRIVRNSSFIYALGWIHLYDDPPGGSKGGLLDAHGVPKPGYYAFKNG